MNCGNCGKPRGTGVEALATFIFVELVSGLLGNVGKWVADEKVQQRCWQETDEGCVASDAEAMAMANAAVTAMLPGERKRYCGRECWNDPRTPCSSARQHEIRS